MPSRETPRRPVEDLLRQQQWLVRLARGLVRDGAEDLAQTTWVRALESPPGDEPPRRGWLAQVVRREGLRQVRRDRARQEREERTAQPEAQSSTLDALDRIATQRRLAGLVLALPEAQREVLVLRFWEDLPPRKIAQRLGLSLEAVKSRQKRALAGLRERLREEYGREDLLGVLMPLAVGAPGKLPVLEGWRSLFEPLRGLAAAPSIPGMAFMSSAAIQACAALALVAGVVFVATSPGSGEGDPSIAQPAAAADAGVAAAEAGVSLAEIEGRAATSERSAAAQVAEPVSAADEPAEVAAAPRTLSGRLVDLNGRPLEGLELSDPTHSSAGALSDAAGHFELVDASRAVVVSAGWTTVMEGMAPPAASSMRCTVIAAPALALAGRVVDPQGVAVAEARVEVVLPALREGRVPADLDHSTSASWIGTTDAAGGFLLEGVPRNPGTRLRVSAPDLPFYEAQAPQVDRDDLLIVLADPEDGDGLLQGVVVDDAGRPVEAATVSFGLETTSTDAEGRFTLALRDQEGMNIQAAGFLGQAMEPGEVRAFAPGHQCGRYVAPRSEEGDVRWPERVVVELGGAPLSIQGRVVDEDNQGVEGAQVWLADSTLMGMGRRGVVVLEGALAATEDGRPQVTTGPDGSFTLAGLQDRDYHLEAVHGATLQRAQGRRVPAGAEGVVLRLEADALWPELRGRVVDSQGQPVENVTVSVATDTQKLHVGDQLVSTRHARREDSSTTGPLGHFELLTVPRRSVYLRLAGPDIIPMDWGRSAFALEDMLADPQRFEITVGIRRRLRVTLADTTRADAVEVLDAGGLALTLSIMMDTGRRDGPRLPLEGGSTGVITVADTAATLVLYQGEREVQRLAVELTGRDVRLFEL